MQDQDPPPARSRHDVAKYFVVRPEPLRMVPGLYRLGHDFGNAAVDALHFQLDSQSTHYRDAKQRVFREHPDRLALADDPNARDFLDVVGAWMQNRIEAECGLSIDRVGEKGRGFFLELSLSIQEDFAVLMEAEGESDRLVLLSVCFPSGWRPERLLGKSFSEIHAPIPEFEAVARKRAQLISGIVQRGPYVRFVWTVTADDLLDHHPDERERRAWTEQDAGLLRVERQTTVPFPEWRGALFLIRTYLYPFSDLTPAERSILASALTQLPLPIARYKGLDECISAAVHRLGGTPPGSA